MSIGGQAKGHSSLNGRQKKAVLVFEVGVGAVRLRWALPGRKGPRRGWRPAWTLLLCPEMYLETPQRKKG